MVSGCALREGQPCGDGVLREAQCVLFLMKLPASPETRENHTLFGETRFLGEVGEGQSSARRCHEKGMERGAREEIDWGKGGSGFIRTRK